MAEEAFNETAMDGAIRKRIEPQDPELRVLHPKGGLRRPHRNTFLKQKRKNDSSEFQRQLFRNQTTL